MEFKIIHHTVDLCDERNTESFNQDAMILGGREAGICYMPDDYFEQKINNSSTAEKRANVIVGTGHHSPFDHYSIGLEISGIPKILAMLINSTEFYTTSEKSARYTYMKPETEAEDKIYHKWIGIFTEKIKALGEDMTDKEVEKLALENARYMLSVFTPTSMGFTTTYRQYCYLATWLRNLVDEMAKRPNPFNDKLSAYCVELADYLDNLTGNRIHDNKAGCFQFMTVQAGHGDIDDSELFYDVYRTTYFGSFAELAQLQRHRTIHYEMQFSGDKPGEFECYIPAIIGDDFGLVLQWVADFHEIKDRYPQCTLVKILEEGRTYWFLKKCRERMCGRAQLEIMKQTEETLNLMYEYRNNMSDYIKSEIEKCVPNGNIVPKCGFKDFKCTEHCRWGCARALTRKI